MIACTGRTGLVKGSREGSTGVGSASQEDNRCARGKGPGDFGFGWNVATKLSFAGLNWILRVLDFCCLKSYHHPQASIDSIG